MKSSLAAAVAATSMLAAFPVAASAHHKPNHAGGPPPWAGTPGGPHGAAQITFAGDQAELLTPGGLGDAVPSGNAARPAAKPAHAGGSHGRCKKAKRVGFVVLGTFAAYEDSKLTVDVTDSNRHARDYLETNEPTFDVSGAKTTFEGVSDTDASGTVGFEDALTTDAVHLGGKLIRPKRGCDAEESVRINRVTVTRPAIEPVIEPTP